MSRPPGQYINQILQAAKDLKPGGACLLPVPADKVAYTAGLIRKLRLRGDLADDYYGPFRSDKVYLARRTKAGSDSPVIPTRARHKGVTEAIMLAAKGLKPGESRPLIFPYEITKSIGSRIATLVDTERLAEDFYSVARKKIAYICRRSIGYEFCEAPSRKIYVEVTEMMLKAAKGLKPGFYQQLILPPVYNRKQRKAIAAKIYTLRNQGRIARDFYAITEGGCTKIYIARYTADEFKARAATSQNLVL